MGEPKTCRHCDRYAVSRGLCGLHYQRWQKGQDLSAPKRRVHQHRSVQCVQCGTEFTGMTAKRRYCSNNCRQRAFLKKPPTPGRRRQRADAPTPPPWSPHDIPVAIVAHPRRWKQAQELSSSVGAEALVWDNAHLGCEASHRRAWEWLAQGKTGEPGDPRGYSVVLEDDVAVMADFRHQLTAALRVAPSPIVSLYLGRGRPPHYQPAIAHAITSLPTDVCWFTAPVLLGAVGYAIRTELLPELLSHPQAPLPIDEQISAWAQAANHTVAYTWPSLVQHRDLAPLITERHDQQDRIEKRVAWRFDTRLHWDTSSAPIKTPEELGMRVISA